MIAKGDSNAIPLASDSVDAVITDPPYGLSFMGKDWDRAVPTVDLWCEVLRVMKPGAFAAVLCTPRQDCQARMIMNLETAGFVTGFTSIMWTYATGFPKAANLSKLADKRAGAERDDGYRLNYKNTTYGRGMGGGNSTAKSAPATPEAKALDGAYAGFQPKPAFEPVLIVMKPLSEKTYLDQVLTNGKGCTWLDGGRIPTGDADAKAMERCNTPGSGCHKPSDRYGGYGVAGPMKTTSGRFPANVLCCDDALNNGRVTRNGSHQRHATNGPDQPIYGEYGAAVTTAPADSGSYSRYFDLDRWWSDRIASLPEEVRRVFPWLIVPKPSKREKNAGLTRPPAMVGDGRKKSIDNAFQRGQTERVNSHVSVKPVKLMSYLITLFSQPGEVVLDPFAGSGTTAVSAELLGRRFVGVELETEYTQIARDRETWARGQDGQPEAIAARRAPVAARQTSGSDGGQQVLEGCDRRAADLRRGDAAGRPDGQRPQEPTHILQASEETPMKAEDIKVGHFYRFMGSNAVYAITGEWTAREPREVEYFVIGHDGQIGQASTIRTAEELATGCSCEALVRFDWVDDTTKAVVGFMEGLLG